MESAAGDIERVQRALARGMFVNAARLEGTAYDIKDLARMAPTPTRCAAAGGAQVLTDPLHAVQVAADAACLPGGAWHVSPGTWHARAPAPTRSAADDQDQCVPGSGTAAFPQHTWCSAVPSMQPLPFPNVGTAAHAGPAPKLRMHPASVLARSKPDSLLFFQVCHIRSLWLSSPLPAMPAAWPVHGTSSGCSHDGNVCKKVAASLVANRI